MNLRKWVWLKTFRYMGSYLLLWDLSWSLLFHWSVPLFLTSTVYHTFEPISIAKLYKVYKKFLYKRQKYGVIVKKCLTIKSTYAIMDMLGAPIRRVFLVGGFFHIPYFVFVGQHSPSKRPWQSLKARKYLSFFSLTIL